MYKFALITRAAFLVLLYVAVSCNGNKSKAAKNDVFIGEPALIEVSIAGMTCTGCEQTIQNNVGKIEGIKSVTASWKTGTAQIEYFPQMTDTLQIKEAVTGSGYKVNKFNQTVSSEPAK